MNISQSLMNIVLDNPCPHQIKLQWVDKVHVEPSESMKRGSYFEWLLLGDSSSEAPQLEKLKSGGKSQAEKDIDALADLAKTLFVKMGIDMSTATTQIRLESDGLSGVIDMIANDIEDKTKFAIYDIKYTETKYDDRFSGWADIETKINSKRQARQYIYLWNKVYGVYLPYYFIVFGKTGWVRVIKCLVTKESLSLHENEIQVVKNQLLNWENLDYPAVSSYTRCTNCRVMEQCKYAKLIPEVEVVEV